MNRRIVALVTGLALTVTACASLPGIEVERPEISDSDADIGGVMTVGLVTPRSLDPADASDASSQLIARTMCDTLLNVDPETGGLVPGIAEGWAVTTRHGLTTVTLKLRQDVYFPDGTQVDARVVADSLSRLAREDTAGSMHAMFSMVQGYEYIRGDSPGDEDLEPPEGATERLTGVRVTDPYGVEILVGVEDAEWVRRLAHPATAIVDDAVGQEDPLEFARRPVCAGPYQLGAAWNPGDEIIRLVRNAEYRGSPWALSGDGSGYADEILFYVFENADEAYKAFAQSRVDVAPAALSVRQGNEPAVGFLEEPVPTFDTFENSHHRGNSHLVIYIGVPGNPDGSFASPQLRTALSQAIDRASIAAEVYDGEAEVATSFLPPVVGPAHRPGACITQIPPTAEPVAAQESMSASTTQLDGQPVPFYYFDGYPGNEALVTAVAQSWHDSLNIVVEPTPLAEEDFLDRVASTGFDGPFLMGWDGDRTAAPQAYLRQLVGTGWDGNVTGFSDPQLDYYFENEIATQGGRAGDGLATQEEQLIALEQAETWVCELMPLLPIVSMKSHWMVNVDRLGSAREFTVGVLGEPVLRELWVKPEPEEEGDEPEEDE
jgi:ABC-type transport system substrate-binding protein